mmetsp:Transcript_46924/g.118766  ORF Transcript_46924/g.118766 Transcript_46924/m.118766 type:complete len:515 (+) Transcript_46924:336-1880(+)
MRTARACSCLLSGAGSAVPRPLCSSSSWFGRGVAIPSSMASRLTPRHVRLRAAATQMVPAMVLMCLACAAATPRLGERPQEVALSPDAVVRSINATGGQTVTDVRRLWADSPRPNDIPGSLLELTDCAYAEGAPHGLSCEKEGSFIVGFEGRGHWIAGGGIVPLSRALCCKLGVPGNVTSEGQPDIPLTPAKPVAVVSFGCHLSTSETGKQVTCEGSGTSNSFLTGFRTAGVVQGAQGLRFYPYGAVECCTPALLLENGDLWSLDRHACVASTQQENCAHDNGFVSVGFGGWRLTRSGTFVPVAPNICCQVSLGDKIQPTEECRELNDCNGRGRCSFGECQCFQGWTGPDCAEISGSGGAGILDSWQLAVVIIGATGMLASLLILCSHLIRLQQREEMEGMEDDMMEPMLLDEAGSVGSVDTSDEEEGDGGEEECECEEEEEASPGMGGAAEQASAEEPAAETVLGLSGAEHGVAADQQNEQVPAQRRGTPMETLRPSLLLLNSISHSSVRGMF